MFTPTHQKLFDKILSLPYAPLILEEVNTQLREEGKRRLRFRDKFTDSKKVEFINGEIIRHAPVAKEHNDVSKNLYNLVGAFVSKNKLGYVGFQRLMITLSRNDYEPDLCFFKKEKAKKFKEGQSLFPAPDLIVEVLLKEQPKKTEE